MGIAARLAGALPTYKVRLDRAAIRQYAQAIGAAEAIHYEVAAARAAGYADVLAPPTGLFGLDLEHGGVFQLLAEAGADPASCLHVEQEFCYQSSACAGDTLVFSPRFTVPQLPGRGSLEFIERHTSVTRPDGRPVAGLRQLVAVRTDTTTRQAR